MTYIRRPIAVMVVPPGEPIYSEMATLISVVEDGAGEFVEVSQSHITSSGTIQINPGEWPAVRDAIDAMISECRDARS